jgi:hypothetical protein
LRHIYISAYDLIKNNSGGHSAITNISGFNYMDWNKKGIYQEYGVNSFEEVMKIMSQDFYEILKDKIIKNAKKKKTEIDLNWSLYSI